VDCTFCAGTTVLGEGGSRARVALETPRERLGDFDVLAAMTGCLSFGVCRISFEPADQCQARYTALPTEGVAFAQSAVGWTARQYDCAD
jgi:hypothetical protein